ncbi:hypothetical protein ANOM_003362 [Aspergillus nomiae NRRL 13137]|uniref:PD-(D/E)XK nuclease-like domain-containing protein n=1 Tax=Aspergillus nomiae NRRL (strain ATCC 15546 / NRRL 13137 / CBS 260.88 / M93) TaxID=1509407 RepID=A0A0L1J9N1_ASPN3|nr:uncharacterized protein ANOM_003362 [Aspergillus nomiae NRRL 13137]KNG88153.1 hypothetical protein ANOM_003362 [Aspergillus nomiae NRRL 13137]
MTLGKVTRWLDQICAAECEETQFPTPLSTSPPQPSLKRIHDSETTIKEPSKKQRKSQLESASDTSSQLPTLRDDGTFLSQPASTASQARQWSPSPARHKTLLANATPRVYYFHERDEPKDFTAKSLFGFLSQETSWRPESAKIQEAATGSWKCARQQRSESSWVTEVTRPMLLASIGDLPLEAWGIVNRPTPATNRNKPPEIDVIAKSTTFTNGYANHVDHPHTGAQVLGAGCEIKPKYGNLLEAEIQPGVWAAGLFSWAFEHRVGPDLPPPLVGFISVGESWEFYIIYGVPTEVGEDNELPGLAEVHVWGPLSDLAGRTSTEKT